MRKPILVAWLCLPLGAWAYHEGPGQELLERDRVDLALLEAGLAVDEARWSDAIEKYQEALRHLPAGADVDAATVRAGRRIRLALNQARMEGQELVQAQRELRELVAEMSGDAAADRDLLADARKAYGSAQYYITWLMRLEGYPRSEWEPEIEIARQQYRLLAERAQAKGATALARKHSEDLESAVKLARMDIQELQGLPLPSQ